MGPGLWAGELYPLNFAADGFVDPTAMILR
jgi:hypothetical protein